MRIISLGAANNKNRMHDYECIDKRQNEIIKLNILVDARAYPGGGLTPAVLEF